ncbi:MAG: type II toxin-antitoxin system RelE/ParE family toxin [Candidatus Competibacteraceae bacterium]
MDETGAYRWIYTARRAEAVYVLHAFQKKKPKPRRNATWISPRRVSLKSNRGEP